MKKKTPTFVEFLHHIYGITLIEYDTLNEYQKLAIRIDFGNRYGK